MITHSNLMRLRFGERRIIERARAHGEQAIGYRAIDYDANSGRPLSELYPNLAKKLQNIDKRAAMPSAFLFYPDIDYSVPKNMAWGRHLRVINGVSVEARYLEIHPDEPPKPMPGSPRYDPDVHWLTLPPIQAIVHISGSKAKLQGLPDGCVPIKFNASHTFNWPLNQETQRFTKRACGKAKTFIKVRRGNIPLLSAEGMTGCGSQGCTFRDGVISEWPGGRGRIQASTMYTPLSRPTGSDVFALLRPITEDDLRRLYVPKDVLANDRRLKRLAAITRVQNLLPGETATVADTLIAASPHPEPQNRPSATPSTASRSRSQKKKQCTNAPRRMAQTERTCAQGVAATLAHRKRKNRD